jgi:hypothetical protein
LVVPQHGYFWTPPYHAQEKNPFSSFSNVTQDLGNCVTFWTSRVTSIVTSTLNKWYSHV